MKLLIIGCMILSSVAFDSYNVLFDMDLETWQDAYAYIHDIQFVGFSFLSFYLCPYSKTEAKALTFFLSIWRIIVLFINAFAWSPQISPVFILIATLIYSIWMLRAVCMAEFKTNDSGVGAYYILFPIHTFWGLLQSVFLPWRPARYESRMISDGEYTWGVNRKEFVKYKNDELKIKNLDYVKVYTGKSLTKYQENKFNKLVGMKAIPGFRDCRNLMV